MCFLGNKLVSNLLNIAILEVFETLTAQAHFQGKDKGCCLFFVKLTMPQ